jgi:lipopolysaccharide biosynthesis protein
MHSSTNRLSANGTVGDADGGGATRLLAFYLPQFHPIPENDQWWGKGFTEWTNVAKARPAFPGHYQPHLPADLGFYDLRVPEVREAQADLARAYGVYGFCYYHYWFSGRRLLERPFDEVLASGRPDFPFCLCWANENWTRAWDGRDTNVLLGQTSSAEDDVAHIRYLLTAFTDRRYVRVRGKPLFLVYRASLLGDPARTTTVWRDEARKAGAGELFLCRVEAAGEKKGDPHDIGFDAAVEFQPDWGNLGRPVKDTFLTRVARKLGFAAGTGCPHLVYDYPTVIRRMSARPAPKYPYMPCVTPSWDNAARRKAGGAVFVNSSPAVYGQWLREVVAAHRQGPHRDLPVFVNAWNEWGEGNHLEPDLRHGRAYLEATREALHAPAVWAPLLTPAAT